MLETIPPIVAYFTSNFVLIVVGIDNNREIRLKESCVHLLFGRKARDITLVSLSRIAIVTIMLQPTLNVA